VFRQHLYPFSLKRD